MLSTLDRQYIITGNFGTNWLKTEFGNNPTKIDLNGSDTLKLNRNAKVLTKRAKQLHLKEWHQVQDELIYMQFYFDFLTFLHDKMEKLDDPISAEITNHFNALKFLQEQMEDYVLGGMMEEERTGEFVSADEALELLQK